MSGKVGMPFTAAMHPRGFGGLFSQKPHGQKVKRKRMAKATAHLASPAKQRKMMMKKVGPRTKPLGFPTG